MEVVSSCSSVERMEMNAFINYREKITREISSSPQRRLFKYLFLTGTDNYLSIFHL